MWQYRAYVMDSMKTFIVIHHALAPFCIHYVPHHSNLVFFLFRSSLFLVFFIYLSPSFFYSVMTIIYLYCQPQSCLHVIVSISSSSHVANCHRKTANIVGYNISNTLLCVAQQTCFNVLSIIIST